jgi:hypothetical protein
MNIHSISWMALHLFSARSIAQPSPRQVVRIEPDTPTVCDPPSRAI